MNALDIFILLCLAAGIVHGFSTGVLRQVSSLVSLIFGFLIALQLMEPLGRVLTDLMGLTDQYGPVIGFITVFLLFHLAVMLLAKLFETVLEVLKLTTANRVLGSVAGAAKAALILGIVFLALGYVRVPDERTQVESSLYGPISQALPFAWDAVRNVFPQVEELSRKFSGQVKEAVEDAEAPDGDAVRDAVDEAAGEVRDALQGG
jgi:membrane protein required for colicin V production